MITKSIIDYLQLNYGITYFKVIEYAGFYIVDLLIRAPANPFNMTELHASSIHTNKSIALLKASVEMIERIVFISPFVGPLDFIDTNAYVCDNNDKLVPISLISPYFSTNKNFNSKGHACHTDNQSAKVSSEFEYYENLLLSNLDNIFHKISDILELPKNDQPFHRNVNDMQQFELITVNYNSNWFAAVWDKKDYGYILGSALTSTEEDSIKKSLMEALSKQEIANRNQFFLRELAEHTILNIVPGRYLFDSKLKKPSIIKRYHQALSDLNLFMYQAV